MSMDAMRSKFTSLPPFLRALAVIVVLGVLGVTAGAFVYSYNALYAVGGQLGGVKRVAWIWPVLIDGQIVVANAGLALAAALNKSKTAMYLWVTLATAASIGFNVWHAGHDRVHWLIAAVAPITIEGVCFVGVKVLDWIMQALGRPTSWALPERQIGYLAPPQTVVTQLPDGSYGVPGSPFPGYGAGTFPPQGAFGQMPSPAHPGTPQIGHAQIDDATKRREVEMYLSRLDAEQLGAATGSSIVVALAERNIPISESHAGRILGEFRAAHKSRNGARTSVRRKA